MSSDINATPTPATPTDPSAPGYAVYRDFITSPEADIRDASEHQIDQIRLALNSDFFFFFTWFFDYPELTYHWHAPVCLFLQNWQRGGSPRKMLEMPRDTGKTTTATRGNSLFQIVRSDALARVGIFNAKESRAKSWIKANREMIEGSREFQRIYKHLMPTGVGYWDREAGRGVRRGVRWSDSEMQFNRNISVPEPSLSAHGATGSAAGYHFTHVIKDDIIELIHALSPAEMQRVIDWVDNARYLESPAEQGCDLFNYTRWASADVYQHVFDKWGDEYEVFARKAIELDFDGNETSAFPEKWTYEQLCVLRERDPYNFSAQMMNIPKAGREQSFNPDWNRFGGIGHGARDGRPTFSIDPTSYDPTIIGPDVLSEEFPPQTLPLWWLDRGIVWDPAPSEQSDRNRDRNARNGKAVVGRDSWDRDFVLEARGTRNDPIDEIKDTIRLAIKWAAWRIAVEEVNFSKIYKHIGYYVLQNEAEFRDYRDKIEFVPQKCEKTQKDARILELIGEWRMGLVYLNEPLTKQLTTEALDYPFASTRDILDALAMRHKLLRRPMTPDEYMLIEEQRFQRNHRASESITGYEL